MTTPLNPQTVQRLAFIRFLYDQGVAQTRQPQPTAATSVLSFHDAAELFLILAGEHLQANLPTQINFAEYWTKLGPKLPPNTELPSKKAMERMNKLRVNLKHYGAVPSPTDIEQVRADVTTFFTDATSLIFRVDFHQVDMTDLVTDAAAAKRLQDAQAKADAGDFIEALAELRAAFDDLLSDYAYQKKGPSLDKPFLFGPSVIPAFQVRSGMATPESKMIDAITEMQKALRVIAVGIDYRKYARFAMLVPTVHRNPDGKIASIHTHLVHDEFGLDEYQFCRQFVIEAALQISALDYDLDLWERNLQIARERGDHVIGRVIIPGRPATSSDEDGPSTT